MGGRDKGLVPYRGRPLVSWVLDAMGPQVGRLNVVANRNPGDYAALLHATCPSGKVRPDDPDLPPRSGPLAGVLTALRHSTSPWIWVNPCDTPGLPHDLLDVMMRKALQTDADVVLPVTGVTPQDARHHWLCVLINTRVCPHTEQVFASGERKIGQWVRSLHWETVSFDSETGFMNINNLETPHGRD